MSSPLKSFEGPDVEALLDEIRADLGPGAKINGAEKIRVGGVLGFFARERYRVVVEAPDDSGASSPDLTPSTGHGPAPVVGAEPVLGADVFSFLADATDDVNDVHHHPGAPDDRAATAASGASVGATTTTGTETFDAVLSRVTTTLEAPPVDVDLAPVGIATKAAQFLAETEAAAALVPHAGAGAGAGPVVTPSAAPVDLGAGPDTPHLDEPESTPVTALRRVGLSSTLVEPVIAGLRRGESLEALLLDALSTLPPVPAVPALTGSLLVVVGAGPSARRLAATVAGDIGLDPASVPLASLDPEAYSLVTGSLLVRSAEQAAEHAPGWRRSAPAVVVVDACVTSGERSWASHLLSALRPTAVWGVVDSTAKTEDIAAWVEALGGMDALALENTDATVSPAAALGLGLPVVRLNGQPATATRWVATIVDRVRP